VERRYIKRRCRTSETPSTEIDRALPGLQREIPTGVSLKHADTTDELRCIINSARRRVERQERFATEQAAGQAARGRLVL
jgi:hypothetical protein